MTLNDLLGSVRTFDFVAIYDYDDKEIFSGQAHAALKKFHGYEIYTVHVFHAVIVDSQPWIFINLADRYE